LSRGQTEEQGRDIVRSAKIGLENNDK
ncbi:MAG: hypothetical protein EZS28_036506, partial [Streblomastix strix]